MIVEEKAGYIILALEPLDWKLNAKGFLKELKESIPLDDREYDSELQQWYIQKRWQYILRDLRDKYFKDKNQTDMFK